MHKRFLGFFVLLIACSSDSTDSGAQLNITGDWQANIIWTSAQNLQFTQRPPMHFTQSGSVVSGTMDDESFEHHPSQPFTGTLAGSTLTISGVVPGNCNGGHYTLTMQVTATLMTVTSGTGEACIQNTAVLTGITATSGTVTKL